MFQTALVLIIVAAAVYFVARRLARTLRGEGGCGCGCKDCPQKRDCSRRQ